ncbi:hypothetical protein NW762_013178 [Fusarium torreyae]|uniref:Uncharacterized protein n=1 Tax=Fusarium torreyae TaxID=1237075 RepID=A0A9W8RMP2_9HYPO|nr:hypothetical protein NW762_013178 [Fusarium torreyae]
MAAPSPPSKAWDHQVDDRVNHIVEKLDENPEFAKKNVPGLKDLLSDFASPNVTVSGVEFHRRLLQVFKGSETDGTYSQMLSQYTPEEQDQIEKFVSGANPEELGKNFTLGPSLGCREELCKLQQADSIFQITSHSGFQDITPAGQSTMPLDGISNLMSFSVAKTAQAVDDWFDNAINKLADFLDDRKPDY